MRHKTIMCVAGETSGDMHAARVIEALRFKNKKLIIFGMGGPLMKKAGMDVRHDLTRHALIGFWEVLKHYPAIKGLFKECEGWLWKEKPELLVLVDFPGFNLRLAESAHRLGVPVCYYIAPKVWAWNEKRVGTMKKVIQKLLVIFPFEKTFFRNKGIKAVYVGNPLIEEMDLRAVNREAVLRKNGISASAFPLISAMPGSRRGEIEKIFPLYLEASRILRKTFPDAAFVIPKPQGLEFNNYKGLTPGDSFFFVEAPAYDLRKVCDAAWVKSGTSTLETALLKVPMVVVYKVAALTGFLAKRFIKIQNVSLVNLLADRTVVKELLQEKADLKNLLEETLALLENKTVRMNQIKAFEKIRKNISKPPHASVNVAKEILALLNSK